MSTTPTERLLAELGPNRRNLAALAAVVGVLAFGHFVAPHWATRYGSYLVAFSVWMIWFVLVLVEVLQYDW
jgi:hypothetical protein